MKISSSHMQPSNQVDCGLVCVCWLRFEA